MNAPGGGAAEAVAVRAGTGAGSTPIDLPLAGPGATFIEASAGTGKTHALTTLVARLVVEEGLRLDRILVVTFTRAAAAELRDRIRRTLAGALAALGAGEAGAEGSPQARDLLAAWERSVDGFDRAVAARRLASAVHDADLANVHTIHGFCRQVLNELAFESGFPFGFELTGEDGALVAGAVRDSWRRRFHSVSALLARYVVEHARGFFPDDLAAWVAARRAKTADVVGGEPPAGTLEAREAAWLAVFEAARAGWERHGGDFRAEVLEGGWINRQRYRPATVGEELDRIEALLAAPEPRLPPEGLAGRYGEKALSSACKRNFTLPECPLFQAFDRLEEVSRELRAAYGQWLRWTRAETMAEVRASVRRRIREERRLGYDDLTIELADALEGAHGERLAERVRREYPCALIDEYQDTDPVQARIFTRIYGTARGGVSVDRPAGNAAGFSPRAASAGERERGHAGERGCGNEEGGDPGARERENGPGGGDEHRGRSGGACASASALFAVGDPKQSIYRFRGADVFAYLAARRAARNRLFLDRNWRSVPALVEAVNAVFAGSASFMTPEIEYHPVAAAAGGSSNPLRVAGDGDAPFRLRLLPGTADGRPRTKESARRMAADAAADEIAHLLERAGNGAAVIEDGDPEEERGAQSALPRPLVGADVAVLVRTREQGRLAAAALRERGVRCIEVEDRSVFATREAEHLERLLRALAEPGREASVRGALAGDLFGLDLPAMLALGGDEERWSAWVERLARWRADWDAKGVGPLLFGLFEAEGAAERLLRQPDGPRRLTNYRHLAEILQEEETRLRSTPMGLAGWLGRRRAEDGRADERTQLRLESDEQLVKVLTVHGAKGLEFPVVFYPFAWDARPPGRGGEDAAYHRGAEEDYREVLDLHPDDEARERAWLEEFAESLRLLYVALTRAKYRCVVGWGREKGAECAPLAWLLHRQAPRDEGPAPGPEEGSNRREPEDAAAALSAAAERFAGLGQAKWRAEVEEYARRFPDAISVTGLDTAPRMARPERSAPPPPPLLAARELRRPLRRIRQMTSFSALSAEARSTAEGVPAGAGRPLPVRPDAADPERPDHDRRGTPPRDAWEDAGGAGGEEGERSAFTFPRGPVAGSCLHRIFERLDDPARAAPDESDPDTICRNALEHFGIDVAWAPAARTMVERTREVRLHEPAREASSGFRLRDPVRRLVELEFHVPVDGFDREGFGARLEEYGYPNPFPRPEKEGEDRGTPPERTEPLSGFLRGFVDVVVEHEGRWYVLDYKSNWLGAAPGDYRPAALDEAMREGGYALQYLIYLAALHRHLSVRLPGYEYERHMGGAFYLFVRGIDPAAGVNRGVYFDRPSAACVHALDDCFRGAGVR